MNGGGLTNHSNDDLAAVMAGKKVGVGFSMTDRSFVLTGNTNRKDLETQLQLQTAYLMYPGYREDGVVQLPPRHPHALQQAGSRSAGSHEDAGSRPSLYKNNPRFTFPAQKQLESYQIKEVRDWVDAPLKNNYMEVTVTGDFKPEDIIPMLERTVGALPKRADAPAALDEKRAIRPWRTSTSPGIWSTTPPLTRRWFASSGNARRGRQKAGPQAEHAQGRLLRPRLQGHP